MSIKSHEITIKSHEITIEITIKAPFTNPNYATHPQPQPQSQRLGRSTCGAACSAARAARGVLGVVPGLWHRLRETLGPWEAWDGLGWG